MRNPETILNSLSAHSKDVHYKYERLYRILFNEQMFYVAYQRIYAKPGNMTPGSDDKTIDGMSIERIGHLIATLKDESYMPTPARRVYIPKKNGKKRPLGIPSIEDKMVQEVVRLILEAIYEGHFENTSHGFRPRRSCQTALRSIRNLFTGANWFIEGDIKGFFDNIDHHILIDTLRERISDERFIRLIWKFLKAGYIEDFTFHNTYSGTPQGGIISPILANVYLDKFDKYMREYAESFDKGKKRRENPLHAKYSRKAIRLRKAIRNATDEDIKRELLSQLKVAEAMTRNASASMAMDSNYKRLKYIRYDDDLMYKLSNKYIEELESRVSRYKTVDGILYSADMKTLVLCPKEKTGGVIIPDGVTRIRRQAFCLTKISRVVFPDSLARIEDEAFYQCKNLKEIDFGNGIEQLGADGKQLIFSGCAFERLVFPSQIKEIGVSAFYACHKLKEIVFNEGLEKIAIGAFKNCMMLREVNLPASIRELGKSAFVCIPNNRPYGDLHINMTTIPDNLVKALVYYGSLKTLRCIYVHIDNANGVYDFVLPDSITSIRNGYSKIALDFNMLANTEYIHNTKRLETAFHYAASSRYECIVAYKTYLKTKHKAAKEFMEKEQYRVAAAIIEELDEKDFVNFVKLRCINLEYDSCIMKRLQEKNWNIALAYMLEEGKGKTKDALVI